MQWRDQAVREALRLWPRVYGYAVARTGDPVRAEDLCQEAYLRLMKSAARGLSAAAAGVESVAEGGSAAVLPLL